MPDITCTPSDVASIDSCRCLNCLSTSQLRMVLLLEWANLFRIDLGDETDRNKLLRDSVCFTCLGEKQRLEQLVCMFGNIAFYERGEEGIPGIVNQMKCLPCLTPAQVESAILYLICQAVKEFIEFD